MISTVLVSIICLDIPFNNFVGEDFNFGSSSLGFYFCRTTKLTPLLLFSFLFLVAVSKHLMDFGFD